MTKTSVLSALLASILAFTGTGHAQEPAPLITNIEGRQTISLNGRWQIIVDPYEAGYYDYQYRPRRDGYFANAKPTTPSDLVEYDFDASEQLNVPGDWNSQDERLIFYEGTVWYKKSFDYLKNGSRVFVYFGAANYEADVYLNGQKLGRHEGGFTPFNFEITRLVREKDNFLIVKVDNKRRREGVPTLNTDWWNYGGLTRDVALVEVPDTFIEDYFIQLNKRQADRIAGWVRLNGAGRGRRALVIGIPEAGIRQTVTTDDGGYALLDFTAQLQLWSPESPKLYRVTIAAGADSVADRIGFRTIETRGADILLNGRPVFLRGISIHEESPLSGGRAFSKDDARLLLGWAKELGCNFVRLAHYPHNEHITRLADEIGLMVWSEIPVYWTILWDDPRTFESAKRQLEESITRDKNRASIILWSVANETPLGDARMTFLKGLIGHARALDPTRLLTAANERRYADAQTLVVDDPLGEHLDVLGCNEYVGWYDGLPEKAAGLTWKVTSDKPLVISEFGAGALFGNHGDKRARWTEEYQADLYEHQITMLRKIPSLRGMSPWILVDFRSPRRPLPRIQDFYNRKGLLSDRGERKQAFFVLQRFYRELMGK